MKTILVTMNSLETAQHASLYASDLTGPLSASRTVLYDTYDRATAATDNPVSDTDTRLAHEGTLLMLLEKD